MIDNCQEQYVSGHRREGEPRRWVAKHTDQHVVRPEPFERGMNFVVQSREAADRLAEILNAQPAPPDLVDAAHSMIEAVDELDRFKEPHDEKADWWQVRHRRIERLNNSAFDLRQTLPAALQNTPQPDESEAVKLLRELAQAAADVIPHIEQPFSGRSYVSDNLDEARRKADTFLSNTPEVDR